MLTNEFGKIRKVGLTVRVTLYSICTLSYFSFFYPILLGRIGVLPFWLGILSSILVLTLIWMFNFRGSQSLKKTSPSTGPVSSSFLFIRLLHFSHSAGPSSS
jgi:hypothetical protein